MGFDAVALVSGGKDSVMAAMMAQSYGHDIVALANLLPADGTIEELDSHCFQTVGHRAVGVYHELTGLPLFRRKIGGTSAHVEMSYDVCDERVKGDEVEDLRALLAAVVREMPNVKAVTSGAILSDYQRLRVEAVCADLGLVSLAYLWRQPQGLMLETICDSDVDAVLCKVAAMGLVPKRDLGRTLADARETLYTIEQTYGSHCCGEGGEFETITMDCPLFRRGALRFEGTPEVVVTSPDPFAPSAHLAIAAVAVDVKDRLIEPGRLVDVDDAPPPPPQTRRRTIDAFQEVLTTEQGVIGGNQRLTKSWRRAGPSFWTVAAAVPVSGPTLPVGSKEEAARSTEASLHFAELSLRENGLDWGDVALVQLYVRDMSHFSAVNEAYTRVVPSTQPPARACVQLPLPEDTPVALDVLVGVGSTGSPRKSLHVQSLSCWAPACIGPYAQAVTHLGLTHMAGVIGMVPATLDIIRGDAGTDTGTTEARRAWRSAAAVARVTGSTLGRDCLSCTMYAAAAHGDGDIRIASDEVFAEVMRGEGWQDDVDVPGGPNAAQAGVSRGPSGVHRNGADSRSSMAVAGDGSGFGASEPRRWSWDPLVTHVTVPGLPKDARVEVQPVLLDGDGPGGRVEGGEPWDGDVTTSRMAVRSTTFNDGDVTCVSLWRAGRFCRAHAAFPKSADDIDASAVGAFRAVVRAVEEAGLTVGDIGCARLLVASDDVLDTEQVRELGRAVDQCLEVQCAVVPVLRASFGSVDDAFLVLEVTAAS